MKLSGNHSQIKKFLYLSSPLLSLVLSCGSPPKMSSGPTKPTSTANAEPTPGDANGKESPTPAPIDDPKQLGVYRIRDNASDGLQRKTPEQLVSSIAACVGASPTDVEILKVQVDMLTPKTTDVVPPAKVTELSALGRKMFLGKERYEAMVGQTIIDVEKEFLDSFAGRTSVKSDSVEDENYLKSLGNVADVVAWNCNLDATQCDCSTPAKAKAMLDRCLPIISSARPDINAAAQVMSDGGHCGSGDKDLRRRAIASLISSYAFAAAK